MADSIPNPTISQLHLALLQKYSLLLHMELDRVEELLPDELKTIEEIPFDNDPLIHCPTTLGLRRILVSLNHDIHLLSP